MDWLGLVQVAGILIAVAFVTAILMGILKTVFYRRLERARPFWKTTIAWFLNAFVMLSLLTLFIRLGEMFLSERSAACLSIATFVVLVVVWGEMERRLKKHWPRLFEYIGI